MHWSREVHALAGLIHDCEQYAEDVPLTRQAGLEPKGSLLPLGQYAARRKAKKEKEKEKEKKKLRRTKKNEKNTITQRCNSVHTGSAMNPFD